MLHVPTVNYFFQAWFVVVAIIRFLLNSFRTSRIGSILKITYHSLTSI